MSVEVHERDEGRIVEVLVTDKLSRDDYQRFVPDIERLIRKHGRIRLLFEMHDFHGWDACALWEDLKFDVKHFSDIDRLAMVGEKTWQKVMSVFCRPFTTAEIRYFDRAQIDQAREWLQQP